MTYFPVSQFSILLGVSLIPILISTYLISFLYSIIIGDGTVFEADWIPVSIGFAIACGVLLYKVPYNLYIGRQLLATAATKASAEVDPITANSVLSSTADNSSETVSQL